MAFHSFFCEEDAYLNILHAKEILDNNPEIINSVNEKLKKYQLVYEKGVEVVYLNEWVNAFLAWELKSPFDAFLGAEFSRIKKSDHFFNKIHLKSPNFLESFQNYAPLLEANEASGLSQCVHLRYLGIDLGADFLITHSLGLFHAFENLSLKASKIYKRDNDNTPTLFLPQIALMAMGEKNKQALGLEEHYHQITFI